MACGSVNSQFGTALLWHAKLKNVSPRLQLLENKTQWSLSSLDSLKVISMSNGSKSPTFDPMLRIEALLGDVERTMNRYFEAMNGRLDRLEKSQNSARGSRGKSSLHQSFEQIENKPFKRRGSQHGDIVEHANKEANERASCYHDNINITLFSVDYLLQVEQSAMRLLMRCSIPKSFIDFETFHGVCILGMVPPWYQFIPTLGLQAKLSLDMEVDLHVPEFSKEVAMPQFEADLVLPILRHGVCPKLLEVPVVLVYGLEVLVPAQVHESSLLMFITEPGHQGIILCPLLEDGLHTFLSSRALNLLPDALCDVTSCPFKNMVEFMIRTIWHIPWFKCPFKLSILKLPKRHLTWLKLWAVRPSIFLLLQANDSWTNLLQEEGNDTFLISVELLLEFPNF